MTRLFLVVRISSSAVAEEEGNELRQFQTIADQLPDPALAKFAWKYCMSHWSVQSNNFWNIQKSETQYTC